MKNKELAALKNEELDSKVKELRKELMKLYSQVAAGTTPKNPGQIRASRRTIARILTLKRKEVNQ